MTLPRGVDVQLGELEGITEPFFAIRRRQRRGDLLPPPQAGHAGVAVAEAEQSVAQVECSERAKAAVAGVAAQGVGEAQHARMVGRELQRAAEDPQRLVKQTPAELIRAQRAYFKTLPLWGHLPTL